MCCNNQRSVFFAHLTESLSLRNNNVTKIKFEWKRSQTKIAKPYAALKYALQTLCGLKIVFWSGKGEEERCTQEALEHVYASEMQLSYLRRSAFWFPSCLTASTPVRQPCVMAREGLRKGREATRSKLCCRICRKCPESPTIRVQCFCFCVSVCNVWTDVKLHHVISYYIELYYIILYYTIWNYIYIILYETIFILYYIILYYILYYIIFILYYIILYIILYYILYYIILYYIILNGVWYYMIWYDMILYYIILYDII